MTQLTSSEAASFQQLGVEDQALNSVSNEAAGPMVPIQPAQWVTPEPRNLGIRGRTMRELLRSKDGYATWVSFSETADYVESSDELLQKLKLLESPLRGMSLPTRPETYGTTELLFRRVKDAIAEQTQLSDRNCALLAFWVFSTWFQDANPILPALVVTGSAFAGNRVLQCLQALSFHSLLLAGSILLILRSSRG